MTNRKNKYYNENMVIIYFLDGLLFGGVGLATFLQIRRGGEFSLAKHLPWLAAFGFIAAISAWVDMFLVSETSPDTTHVLVFMGLIFQPISGVLLLIFGWQILTRLTPLPSWGIFVPGILIVPIAYAITFAATTFVTPSPIKIPIDIWSRYLLYLPGSMLAGIGFLRLWRDQKKAGLYDISRLMLGAGLAFIFEAFIVGLVVPAAPYGPSSYYNYDRTLINAFTGEKPGSQAVFGLNAWLDYDSVLAVTGLPIQIWRLISAAIVVYFIVRSLDVFEAIRKRQLAQLEMQRDQAEHAILVSQITARETAESWSDALVNISRHIVDMDNMDQILLYILENTRILLKSNYIAIALFNDKTELLETKYLANRFISRIVDPPFSNVHPAIIKAFHARQSLRINEFSSIENIESLCPFETFQPQKVMIIPISLDASPIGVMWIARESLSDYSDTDLIWLECMADQVVIAVKHGLMTAQLQSLSVVQERGRIAREMHDGLAQVLGYLNVQVQTLEAFRRKENWSRLDQEMQKMRQAIQQAQADVRENILSLRTTLANEGGLIQAIMEYLDEFGIQTGIEVSFDNQAGEDLGLSSIAEVQLVCILQESLTNVRKHAHAKKVSLKIRRHQQGGESAIRMSVDDDGIGFIPQLNKRNFGLQTMRERAQSVNGFLVVSSNPVKGSRVDCILPCVTHEQIPDNTYPSTRKSSEILIHPSLEDHRS